MTAYRIAVLAGDGIGPEVTGQAVRVLEVVGKQAGVGFEFEHALIGGVAIDATGGPLPPQTLALCRAAQAILFGAVGGPKWDHLPQEQRAERGLLAIRKDLDLYANLRPAVCFPMLVDASPLKRSVVEGTDIMVIRELTGGLYYGEPRGIEHFADGSARGINTMVYTSREIERVARVGFEVARSLLGLYVQSAVRTDSLVSNATIGGLLLFVVWTYYMAFVFLLGGQIAQVYELRRRQAQQRLLLR